MKKWVCFFSQTGKEIIDISEIIGRFPDLMITNKRPSHLRTIDKRVEDRGYTELPNRPTVENYRGSLGENRDILITLHGWLRVVPKEICKEYPFIFNGHPALVNIYSELKGKDQQETIFYKKDQYPEIGSIIHKVTPGVDEGEIVYSCRRKNDVVSLEDAYYKLRETSLDTWKEFFKEDNLKAILKKNSKKVRQTYWEFGKHNKNVYL